MLKHTHHTDFVVRGPQFVPKIFSMLPLIEMATTTEQLLTSHTKTILYIKEKSISSISARDAEGPVFT